MQGMGSLEAEGLALMAYTHKDYWDCFYCRSAWLKSALTKYGSGSKAYYVCEFCVKEYKSGK